MNAPLRPAEGSPDAAVFRRVVDQLPLMAFVNQQGRVVYTNDAPAQLLGYTREEILAPGFDFRQLLTPESRPAADRALRQHQNSVDVEPIEYELLAKDGRRVPVVIATRLIEWSGGPAILGVVTDLSAFKAIEASLQQSESRYRTLLETCPDGIVGTDLTGNMTIANLAAARMRGYPSVEALLNAQENAFTIIVEGQQERAARNMELTLRTGRAERLEYDTRLPDGSLLPVELTASVMTDSSGTPNGFVAVVRDLSEQRTAEAEKARLEEQLRHSQRLESLGVLAGGIAHDFNNLLVGILGNAQLALTETQPSSHLQLCLEQIAQAARSAAELTAQMLAYTGKGPLSRTPLDLTTTVHDLVPLLTAAVPKRVLIHVAADEQLPTVLADTGQFKQVVMNLITNAGEAMPDRGGVIDVELRLVARPSSPPPGLVVGELAANDDYVALSVRDTGSGMDGATRQRMFDPFFTTKFTGRGLGLAAVLGIVRNHRGLLAVESAPGRGTTLTVWWPASPALAPALPLQVDAPQMAPSHGGLVLVIDDEEVVLGVAERALAFAGFDVLTASDGAGALELVQVRGTAISAAVLDLTMPGMSGVEVFRHIRALAPTLPVIMSSGYSRQEAQEILPLGALGAFIQKPYEPAALVRLVRETIAARARAQLPGTG